MSSDGVCARTVADISSKKYGMDTSSAFASRLELTRFPPFSYFWTCWKVSPIASASATWLMPRSVRRKRMRAPTCTSMGLGKPLLAMRPEDLRARFAIHFSN